MAKVPLKACVWIFGIGALLLVMGTEHILKDNDLNQALVYFGLVTFAWGITVVYRYCNPDLSKTEKWHIKIPERLKCAFGERRCDEGDFNIWTVAHFAIYFIAGWMWPGHFWFFLGMSLACEAFEVWLAGFNAKWMLDPFVNMLGYVTGSWQKVKQAEALQT